MATVLALSALSGRGTVAMWGYPLWLFLGVWLVLIARRALDELRLGRVLLNWAIVFTGLAIAFIGNYGVLPHYDHRYRAVFFPGGDLGREMSQRYRAVTGKPIAYVIGSMWDGGNVAHYAASHPRVLIDGKPERAPWIDLADLEGARRRGGVDRRRSQRRAGGVQERSPSMPRCSRRSCCTTGAAIRASMSAGRSCCRSLHTPEGLAPARDPEPMCRPRRCRHRATRCGGPCARPARDRG